MDQRCAAPEGSATRSMMEAIEPVVQSSGSWHGTLSQAV
jgi:hypothetical protein